MKSLIFTFLLLISTQFAQVQLGIRNIPASGDEVYIRYSDNYYSDSGLAGTGNFWDFREAPLTDGYSHVKYAAASETPYAAEFPDADLAMYEEGAGELAGYVYYKITPDGLDIVGIRTILYSDKYLDPSRQLQIPFSYGSFLYDEYVSEWEMDGIRAEKKGVRTISADGSGTIGLPQRENTDVLRIRTEDRFRTTYYAGELEVGMEESKTTSFIWYDNQSKFPLFAIHYFEAYSEEDTLYDKFVEVYYPGLSTAVDDKVLQPNTAALEQNYPNPFNPATEIRFAVSAPGMVSVAVYDMLGREVSRLVDGFMEAGNHAVTFNASGLSSGTYIYTVSAAGKTISKKMTLLK